MWLLWHHSLHAQPTAMHLPKDNVTPPAALLKFSTTPTHGSQDLQSGWPHRLLQLITCKINLMTRTIAVLLQLPL
jgi:hypothetical protein